jgi:DNA-damage-inducible protein J
MNKSAYISVRIRPEVKTETEKILQSLGVTPTEAITMFYSQINLRRGLPFPVEIPNEVTRQAIQDAVNGVGIQTVDSINDLMKAMDE